MKENKAKVGPRRDFVSRAAQSALLVAAGAAVSCASQTNESQTNESQTSSGSQTNGSKRKKVITSDKAALPVGPYSQGIRAGDFIFVAGEKGLDPETGKIVPGGIAAETRQAMENIKAILEEEGASLDDAVSSVVYLTDIDEFNAMNEVYGEYFDRAPPGRTTVGVNALPAGARVEITITALSPTT